MMPSGPLNPMGPGQPVGAAASLLRTSSSLLSGGQQGMGSGGGMIPSQSPFSSLVSPRTQFGANGLLGGGSNVSSLLNRPFGNGGHMLGPGLMPGGGGIPMNTLQQQRGGLDGAGDLVGVGGSDPLSFPSSSQVSLGNQLGSDNLHQPPQHQQQQQQLDAMHDLQQQQQHQQLPMSYNQQHLPPQPPQQPQATVKLENGGSTGGVKLEPQMGQPDQNSSAQMMRNASNVKIEPQQLQALRSLSADNNIEYWRNFVNEYFSPNAKKRWCVSLYGSGRQTTGVFPQDVWHCEICNRKPGRGFETTVEVLPRLCQIKYASGTLEELLYVDMPRESQNASGQIVLDYTKAIQESVFEQLRVVREGHLRIVFNPDLKIASWEFCARRHEELIPRRSIIPQVSQLGAVVQKYQSAVQNSTNLSTQDMQNNCNSFVACARQLAKALEVPLVNDLGYTKRYVRCLQIAEVVNCMKDLIDYSRQNGSGPIASLHSFPRRTSSGVSPHQSQQQQPEEQQSIPQSSNQSGQNAAPMTGVQASASANADVTSNNSLSCAPSTSAPSPSVVGLLQGSMNSRQDHPMSSANGPYTSGNSAAIPKVNSTTSLQSNPSTSFPSPMPTTSNNNMMPAPQSTNQLSSPTTSSNLPPMQPPATRPQEPEPNESQSSVQRILQDLMMSPQMNGIGQLGNDMKRPNGLTSSVNGVNCLVGNAVTNNSGMGGMGGMGFGAMGGLGPNHAASGLRTAMVNNAMAISGRMGMNHSAHDLSQLGQLQQQQQHQQQQQQQQHDLGNQLLNGLRAANSFNNLQYDWKPSQ
uniref:Transcriptional corepressor SEUSS n=1 Tax=Oryza barthii TaxID=65489 RepID=A0A0D3HJD3_9ORYZ